MNTYRFPGSPAFLDAAAERLGMPEAAAAARGDATLAAAANLCAQAAEADASRVAEILSRATLFRDRIEVTLLAADLMLDGVREGRGVGAPQPSRHNPATIHGPNAGRSGRPNSRPAPRSK